MEDKMAYEDDVRNELKDQFGNDKAKMMKSISDRQKEIMNMYGGNISDIPVDPTNEYWANQRKLNLLNTLRTVNSMNPPVV